MWQLLDIGYAIPVMVLLGFGVSKFLEAKYGVDYSTACILISAVLGFVLTFFKIKKYIDSVNNKPKDETD